MCRADLLDDEILFTNEPEGVYAIREPRVKVVILNEEISPAVQNFMSGFDDKMVDKLSIMLSRFMDAKPDSFFADSFNTAHGFPGLPIEFADDFLRQVGIYKALTGRSPGAQVFSDSPGPITNLHVDSDLTVNKAYSRAGLTLFRGKMLKKEFMAARKFVTRFNEDPPGLSRLMLTAGQTAVFKGNRFGPRHIVAKGRLCGAPHRGFLEKDCTGEVKRVAVACYAA